MDSNNVQKMDTELLAYFLQKSYRNEKPMKLIEAEVVSGAKSGDNYGSSVLRVKMKFICGSGKIKRRSMIVKTERNWKEMAEYIQKYPIFRNEVKMYSSIFSLMEDLMEEFDDKRGKLWPTMYGFLPYNLIALEDLKESNLEVADRTKSLDLSHAKVVLRSLARFHAMSKVLIARGLLTKEDRGAYPGVEPGGIMDKLWAALLTVFSDAILEWDQQWHTFSEKLKNIKEEAPGKMRDLAANYDPRFEVLNHGDIWLCNIMFGYLEHENIPISAKFIDFQGCYVNSFVMDVMNFMITSVVPSIRRENTDQLLEIYHESFSDNLKFFDYSGYIPTLDDVKDEWKRMYFVQLIYLGLQVITSTEEADAFDVSKIMTCLPHEVFKLSAFTNGKPERTIGEDLKYYHNANVF